MKKPEIILALDCANEEEASGLLQQFPEPVYLKIGMEFFYAFGSEAVRRLKAKGYPIFLDLKLHDIPNTVARALKPLAELGVDMVNVHASGGVAMMREAVKAVKAVNPECRCIAVSLLTSLNEENLSEALVGEHSALQAVLHYAENAKSAGMDGVVCSVHEVEAIHRCCGEDFLCVTPGISYQTADAFDQKRTASPQQAKQAGADYIVVGRSITQSVNPYQTYLAIQQELAE